MTAKLTPKQEAFAYAYVEHGTAAEAYRLVYSPKGKPETCQREGHRLVKTPKISTRIGEIREELAQSNNITLDTLLEELEEARSLALDSRQPAPAVTATMGKAKLLGLDKQIIDHTSSDGSMTPGVIERVIIDPRNRKASD